MNSNRDKTEERGFVSASLSDGSSPEIVVIGDDDIASIIQRYISDAGYDVTSLRDVSSYATSASADGSSELIVQKVTRSMLKDGELQIEERLERNNVPVLVISGPTLTESQVGHTKANIVGWLTKPFGRAEFVQQVEDSIKRMTGRGEGELPNSESLRQNGSHPSAGGKSDRIASPNGHDPQATVSDGAATTVQTNSKQDERTGTDTDYETKPQDTSARTEDIDVALDRIQKLETKQAVTSEDVETVTDQLSELSKTLAVVNERLDALDNRIDELSGQTSALETDVLETQQSIDPLFEGLDTIADGQLRLADEVEAAMDEQTELRSTVDALAEWQDDVSVAFQALQESD